MRTENRRDFSVDPTGTTMLDVLKGEGYTTLGVGKIEDIFNHRGLTSSNHAAGNEACVDAVVDYLKRITGAVCSFANLVDTDMLYGHRNDVPGFARCLEAFDKRLPEILRLLGDDGMLIITADHGCDPAFPPPTTRANTCCCWSGGWDCRKACLGGNKPASGTQIIEELGAEHLRTGKLIVYTSADSVFQIAAHEGIIPPTELWHICRIARRMLKGEHAVGRVIARPFVGEVGHFVRTENRRDFSVDPTGTTMLDVLKGEGYDVLGVGKIEDIFNHRGLTSSNHAAGNEACVDAVLDYLKKDHWRGLLFANLVDTDMLYGHRNDVPGFARCLEAFDKRLPEILRLLGDDGMLIITADHGCDPAFPTTDHTREYVPLLVWGLGLQEGVPLGVRGTFADVSATVLEARWARKAGWTAHPSTARSHWNRCLAGAGRPSPRRSGSRSSFCRRSCVLRFFPDFYGYRPFPRRGRMWYNEERFIRTLERLLTRAEGERYAARNHPARPSRAIEP